MEITADKRDRFIYIWLILYCLAGITFFSPVFIPAALLKAVSWVILVATFLYTAKEIFFSPHVLSSYGPIMRYIALMIVVAIFSAYIAHGQSVILNLRTILDVIIFTFFFFLRKENINVKDLEKVIITMTVVYIALFFIALAFVPRILFDSTGASGDVGLNTTRGIARVKVEGSFFVHLSLFLFINKWNLERKKIYLYIIIFLYLIVLLNVSRQHILFAGALAFLMITTNVKFVYKVPIAIFMFAIVNYVMNNVSFIQKLISISEQQLSENSDENIRVRAFNFFMFEYNESWFEDVFGNGIPHANSAWGVRFDYLKHSLGYVPSDVGYAKVFFYFGAIGLALFFILAMKILLQKLPKAFLYCKYYMVFLLCTNVASHTFFTEILTFTFMVYIADYAYKNKILRGIENNALIAGS